MNSNFIASAYLSTHYRNLLYRRRYGLDEPSLVSLLRIIKCRSKALFSPEKNESHHNGEKCVRQIYQKYLATIRRPISWYQLISECRFSRLRRCL